MSREGSRTFSARTADWGEPAGAEHHGLASFAFTWRRSRSKQLVSLPPPLRPVLPRWAWWNWDLRLASGSFFATKR